MSTGEEVAVKVFSQAGHMRPHDVQMREFEVMTKLKHKNIVPMLAIEDEQSTRNKVIIMQLTEHGSLFNMLEDPKNAYGLPEEEFLIVFEHVTAGMKYMRDSGIVHRDIKPGNILRYIGEDGRSIYKLTDFGAAKQLDHEEEQFMSLYGTEEYLHPDMYERAVLRNPNRRQFTATVDLWSMGVTFFHVATGQLPFKPFGGRKNRQIMFEITRHKESGVIMGVQHSQGGTIEWSKELPKTCRLSDGLKLLITPIFARLLESDPSKVWNFDACFREIDSIVKKKVIHVFSPHTWNSLKVYIKSENNLTTLQELIAEQTEIVAPSQLLIFDGQQLKDHVQAMLPISSYPKGITETNPIFVYNKHMDDFARFPVPNIKDFPRFTSSLTTDDYAIAKMCSAISCYILKEVELYSMKQELVRRAVHMYIHELYHELGHLVDYHTFLERNCDSITKWKDNFLRTFKRELTMVGMIVKTDTQLNHIITDLETFHERSEMSIGELSSQITALGNEVLVHLVDLKDQELQKKVLKKQWNDSVGCISEDRCVAKVEVVLEQILKIKLQFSEDRKRPSLTFNEEQIHKYEKNRLSENCTKIKSLFFDHCLAGAKDQFTRYHSWFRMGYDVRQNCEILEKKLLNLADRSEGFVDKLNALCLKYNDEIKLKVQRVQETMSDRDFISLATPRQGIASSLTESMAASGSSKEENKKIRRQMIQTFVSCLEESKSVVNDMKEGLHTNNYLLERFNKELNSMLEDPNMSLNCQGLVTKKDF
ncbi:serine/threonine-protein kinase TBK1-like isoform X2 [Ruditapes philippinarum]|uniref:serine/threonine-protein kinase TBK1-like isoform X2 n=1 Tax=Ruditapes philippinarum TaxID=129788 RepID=UPI00295A673C|nr:serine/threonine-protein kinase TBK1-like isoform X2 [Ruditapes philippinarum]